MFIMIHHFSVHDQSDLDKIKNLDTYVATDVKLLGKKKLAEVVLKLSG